MGIFGPSKSERRNRVAITVYLAEETWHRLSPTDKDRVQAEVNFIFESLGGEQLQIFTLPAHHRWWFYANAMKRLGIRPYAQGQEWTLGKLDPSEFDEESESFQLALASARYVFDESPKVTPVEGEELEHESVVIEATDAQSLVERIGRNEQCPCGSGERYKHCHGKLG